MRRGDVARCDVADPHGVEGATPGLGLLDLRTTMRAEKTTRPVEVAFGASPEPWAALGDVSSSGYEIRNGEVHDDDTCRVAPLVWATGPSRHTVHGLFEDPAVVAAVTGIEPPPVLERTFEALADHVDAHLDLAALDALTRT